MSFVSCLKRPDMDVAMDALENQALSFWEEIDLIQYSRLVCGAQLAAYHSESRASSGWVSTESLFCGFQAVLCRPCWSFELLASLLELLRSRPRA